MNIITQKLFYFLVLLFISFSLTAQDELTNKLTEERDFSDRQAVLTTLGNFYIGDHTGSIKHKKLSMHEKGAYRYINRDGVFVESIFNLDSDDADPNYKEELLSVEIYDKLAIARLRLDVFNRDNPEYKVMTLHKANGLWKITSISWGFSITH